VGAFGTAGKLSFFWQHSHDDLAQSLIYMTIFKVSRTYSATVRELGQQFVGNFYL
jgi:hypothetical protein